MENNGASAAHSMYTLLFLNGGAVVGGLFASMIADRVGAKAVITVTFTLAAISLMILPFTNNVHLTYIPIVIAGVGVLGKIGRASCRERGWMTAGEGLVKDNTMDRQM